MVLAGEDKRVCHCGDVVAVNVEVKVIARVVDEIVVDEFKGKIFPVR